MTNPKLKAKKRQLTGRKVKQLRREGVLPANVYGKDVKSTSISVDLKEFLKTFKEAGETNIVEVKVNGAIKPTLIHNVQLDPVTDTPIHVDFLQVNLKQKVTAQIPVELVNESPAEKQGLGTVVQYIDEIEVEALPGNLPENFEIDLSTLEAVDDMIQIKSIKVDKKKIEIKNDAEQIVVKVEPPREEEEEEVAPAPEAEEGVGAEGTAEEEVAEQPEGEKEETETEDKEEK
jgi:large subunit ribosomal protein L25